MADTTTTTTPSSTAQAVGSSTIQQPQSVTDIYTGLTAQDSPLMQQAAAQANRQAARAGLMNSSMAVGSSRAAQATAAMPLAQAEANQQTSQYQFNRGQTEAERAALVNENQGQQQITNQNTQFGSSLAEQQRAAKAGEGLQQQSITNQNQQFGVTAGQNQQQINNQNTQFGQSLAQQQAESSQQNSQFQQTLAQQKADSQKQSDQFAQSIQANVRGSYTDAANNLLNNSSVNINNISSNANLKQADKDKLIAQEIANRNSDLAYLQNMYGSTTSWADKL